MNSTKPTDSRTDDARLRGSRRTARWAEETARFSAVVDEDDRFRRI